MSLLVQARAFRKRRDMPPPDKIVADVELYVVGRGRHRRYWPAVCERTSDAAWTIEPSFGRFYVFIGGEKGESRESFPHRTFEAAVARALEIEGVLGEEMRGKRWSAPETWV